MPFLLVPLLSFLSPREGQIREKRQKRGAIDGI